MFPYEVPFHFECSICLLVCTEPFEVEAMKLEDHTMYKFIIGSSFSKCSSFKNIVNMPMFYIEYHIVLQ